MPALTCTIVIRSEHPELCGRGSTHGCPWNVATRDSEATNQMIF